MNHLTAQAARLVALVLALLAPVARAAPPAPRPFPGARTPYHGYDRYDFPCDGLTATVVIPARAAPGNPWVWRAEFFDASPAADIALLAKGYHLAYLKVGNTFGCPDAIAHWAVFYKLLTTEHRLSPKPAIEALSRGGLYAGNWAAAHPDAVGCIYFDNAVFDFKSWPGGRGKGKGSAPDWTKLLNDYHFAGDADALAYDKNPIDNLATLAKAGIPIFLLCADADTVVPFAENGALAYERYTALGGRAVLQVKPGKDHHPHGLDDPSPIVNFILDATGQPAGPKPATAPASAPAAGPLPQTAIRSDAYIQLRDGATNAYRKFSAGGPARVAFLGGSITQMRGWRELVCAELQRRFPQAQFDFVHAGISSLDSTCHAFRLEQDVLSKGPTDLMFVEAAVNDSTNGRTAAEQVRGMEGVIRHARRSEPTMDIVMLHFVDPDQITAYRAGRVPEVNASHERVADRYGVPSINLSKEVTDRIDAGEFSWEKDFRGLHPAPFGHQVYARSMARLFDLAWANPPAPRSEVVPHAMPAVIDPACYDAGAIVPVDRARDLKGWSLIEKWRPAGKIGTRPGFVDCPVLQATEPGATCAFEFTGRAVGVWVVAGPDAGMLEYSVDDGAFKGVSLYTQWSGQLHLPWVHVLAAGLPAGKHTLRLRLAEGTDARATGRAARVVRFVVNE